MAFYKISKENWNTSSPKCGFWEIEDEDSIEYYQGSGTDVANVVDRLNKRHIEETTNALTTNAENLKKSIDAIETQIVSSFGIDQEIRDRIGVDINKLDELKTKYSEEYSSIRYSLEHIEYEPYNPTSLWSVPVTTRYTFAEINIKNI